VATSEICTITSEALRIINRVENFSEYENEENNIVMPAGIGIPLSIRTGSAA
jgi:hypothetical protein